MLGMLSCAKDTADAPKEGEVAVVRVTAAIKKGEQISEENVKLDYVKEASIPLNAIRTMEEAVGKYSTADLVEGDYIFRSKLSATVESDGAVDVKAYVSVKSYVKEGADCADIIQNLIDTNAAKTLYFADGTYIISKPLIISAHPDEKVSLELSDFAVIKAADSWSADEAMIRVGARNADLYHDEVGATNAGITGGIIDGNGRAKGIAIEGGRDNTITSVSVKNTTIGITLGDYFGYKARTVVENTNIVGTGDSSIGMYITSEANTLDIVQIDNCGTGIELIESGNTLRNVHVTYAGDALSSCGFVDRGENNSYDTCYSENYAVGFLMGDTVNGSSYSACYIFWNNDIGSQTAFEAEGMFNSSIKSCRIDFGGADADAALLTVASEGGMGKFLWNIVKNLNNVDNDTYKTYLAGSEIIETLE